MAMKQTSLQPRKSRPLRLHRRSDADFSGQTYGADRIVLMLLLVLLPLALTGQPLETLLDSARTQNPVILAEKSRYRAAQERGAQVSQLPDPQVNLGAFVLPVETRLGAQNLGLGISQRLPWFGTLAQQERLADAESEVLRTRATQAQIEVIYALRLVYFSLYEIEEKQRILTELEEVLTSRKALAEAQVAAGKTTLADPLRAEREQVGLRDERQILESQKPRLWAEINKILNRRSDTAILITGRFAFAEMPFRKDTLRAQLSKWHPSLQAIDQQKTAAEERLRLNTLSGKPSFGVGVNYVQISPRTDSDPRDNGRDVLQLSASVQLPLRREKYRAKEREENLRMEQLEHEKQNQQNTLEATLETAFAAHQTARLRYERTERQLELLEAEIRVVETAYRNGEARFERLLDLEKERLNYRLAALSAIVESHRAVAAIQRFVESEVD